MMTSDNNEIQKPTELASNSTIAVNRSSVNATPRNVATALSVSTAASDMKSSETFVTQKAGKMYVFLLRYHPIPSDHDVNNDVK